MWEEGGAPLRVVPELRLVWAHDAEAFSVYVDEQFHLLEGEPQICIPAKGLGELDDEQGRKIDEKICSNRQI